MIEMWKDIEGYEGLYQISNFGNVKSYPKTWLCGGANNAPLNEFKHSGKILKQSLRSNGYFHVCLYNCNGYKQLSIHRLVCISFIKNTDNKPCVNHIDGNKQNNNVCNLEWVTRSENQRHAVKLGLIKSGYKNTNYKFKGENNERAKFSNNEIIELRKLINSKLYTQIQLAKIYNVSQATISKIKLGKTYEME